MKPQTLILPYLALTLCGFFNSTPKLIDGVPLEYGKLHGEFEIRVKSKFPLGSSVKSLVNELKDENFVVNPRQGWALYREYAKSCNRNWIIRWTSDGKTIGTLGAMLESYCP